MLDRYDLAPTAARALALAALTLIGACVAFALTTSFTDGRSAVLPGVAAAAVVAMSALPRIRLAFGAGEPWITDEERWAPAAWLALLALCAFTGQYFTWTL